MPSRPRRHWGTGHRRWRGGGPLSLIALLLLAAVAVAGCGGTPAAPSPIAGSPTPAAATETRPTPAAAVITPPTAAAEIRPTAAAATPPTVTAEIRPTAAPTPTPAAERPTAPDTPPPSGLPLAPDFRFTLLQGGGRLGGETLNLSQLTGKPLVLNFWARLCPPCWSEMPQLQRFYEEYGGRAELLGIDIGEYTGLGGRKDSTGLLASLQVTYPVGFTDHRGIVADYGVRAMPTTIFITADGRMSTVWSGAISYEAVVSIVEEMLAGAAPAGGKPTPATPAGESPAGKTPTGERPEGD